VLTGPESMKFVCVHVNACCWY